MEDCHATLAVTLNDFSKENKMHFQDVILKLQQFWADRGCVIYQPYDNEVGAGTFNPATFLRCLGPEPWNVAYVEPSRRPTDGRYGENPNRLQHYYQFQVILKPSPDNIQELYLESLKELGVDPKATISALLRMTGNHRHSVHGGDSAGKSGLTVWRSLSSPIFSRQAV